MSNNTDTEDKSRCGFMEVIVFPNLIVYCISAIV